MSFSYRNIFSSFKCKFTEKIISRYKSGYENCMKAASNFNEIISGFPRIKLLPFFKTFPSRNICGELYPQFSSRLPMIWQDLTNRLKGC